MKVRNPYKFLDAYTSDDIDIFFGRQKECREIHSRLSFKNILLVYGASGCGKTSILQCGLASVFREELPDGSFALNWLPITIRRKDNIIENINRVFDEHLNENERKNLSLIDKLNKIALKYRKEVYLIFDQFEEVFIFGTDAEKAALVDLLEMTYKQTSNKIIISIREEYLASLTSFEASIPDLFDNRIRIERFNKNSARQLIIKPCQVANVAIDEEAVTQILEKLQLPSGMIELTWLQVIMDSLFRSKAQEDNHYVHISKADSAQLNKLDDVLGDFLNEQIQQASDPGLYENILKCLISDEGTKRHVRQNEIRQGLVELSRSGVSKQTTNKKDDISDQKLSIILNDLVSKRILKEKDDEGRFELRHDSLAACIYKKVTLYEKDLWAKRKLIELYYQDYEKTGKKDNLLPRQVLNSIIPYEKHFILSKEHQTYIQKSKAAAQAKRRHGRVIALIVISVIFVLLSSAAVYSYIQAQKASRERALAQQNERKAIAENYNFKAKELVQRDPTMALRLVEYALTFDPDNRNIIRNLNRIYYDNNFYTIVTRFEHQYSSLEFSSDGKYMLSGYQDGSAILWDIDGNKLQELHGHNGVIRSLAFCPDSKYILTGSNDRTAILWDLHGNKLQTFTGHNGIVSAIVFSPDGKYIVSGSNDRIVRLWDRQGNIIRELRGQHGGITSLAVSPDGKHIISSSRRLVRLWDTEGNILQDYYDFQDIFISTAFSPDGNYILSGSLNRTARIWDRNGNLVQQLTGHQEGIHAVSFSPDGKLILTGSSDNNVKLWDWTGNVIQEFNGHQAGITSMAFLPGRKHIITGSNDQTVRRWELQGIIKHELTGHHSGITSVAFSPDGKYMLTGSSDRTARLWDVNGNLLQDFTIHQEEVLAVDFSPNSRYMLSASGSSAIVWDRHGNILQRIISNDRVIRSAAFSPDGQHFITAQWDKTARLWDLNGNLTQEFSGHNAGVSSGEFSPDGNYLLTGGNDRVAFLWNPNGDIIQTFSGHQDNITAVDFAPDGKYIVTGSRDNTARLYNTNGNLLKIFAGHKEPVSSVRFSANGKYILTASSDNTAILWDRNGNMLQIITGHQNDITSATFSPDNKYILTGSLDRTAKLWEIKINYQLFHQLDNYEQLYVKNKIAYDILTFQEVLKLEYDQDLLLAADYYHYLAIFDTGIHDNDHSYADYAMQLLNKLILNNVGVANYHIKTLEIISLLERQEALKKRKRQFDLLTNSIEHFSNEDKLVIANYLYENIDNQISLKEKTDFSLLALKFFDAAIKNTGCVDCALPLAEISFMLILNKQPKQALDAILLAIEADPDFDRSYAYLPLIYILNNDFDKAKNLYLNHKYRPIQNVTYKSLFLQLIREIKNHGISHPDFENMIEFLENS